MNRAHPRNGGPAVGSIRAEGNLHRRNPAAVRRTGFTLLEMCMVLFIIALLFGVTMPAMQSAFVEQALRKDAHQFALTVKTAMIQSAEQHRAYALDLTATSMALHPVGEAAKDPDAPASADDSDADAGTPGTGEVNVASDFDSSNRLLAPDPLKADAWIDMPPTTWTFQPGQLCPATPVRFARGDAWIDLSFSALTGNVEKEGAYLP